MNTLLHQKDLNKYMNYLIILLVLTGFGFMILNMDKRIKRLETDVINLSLKPSSPSVEVKMGRGGN